MDEKKFFELIAKYANFDAAKISEDMSFAEDLGLDSLDLADIISAIEDEYNIEITDEELMDGIDTVGDALKLIKEKVEE
jgi:acyl carrier protein